MGFEAVHIEELRLRVPGLTELEARRLGEEVARRVAYALPAGRRGTDLGLLELRVSLPVGMPKELLAERIAEGILKNLR